MVQGRARAGSIRLVPPRAMPGLGLRGDRRGVMQVLLNLLTNAVKFTGAGGLVSVRVEHHGALALIVEDTGVGIPADALPHIFEPFRRGAAHISRKAEGTGLGLAISRKLMERHGGTLDLESTPGVGTLARAAFPAERVLNSKAAPLQSDTPAPAAGKRRSGARV
jgi:two-component system cell cycle sensor histidine kinase PleC